MTDVFSVPATGPRQASRSSGRRPALDGMRALAVYLVVAFHTGLGRFTGGFIGVDVFFVLSGYLRTLGPDLTAYFTEQDLIPS